jgi:cysteine-S-conjugate beta-lyase
MALSEDIDRLTPTVLRARGGWKWRMYGPDVLPAWLAETDFPVAPPIASAVHDAIKSGGLGYTPPDYRLAEAFASWAERRQGWQVDPRHTALAVDVLAGIERALRELTRRGDGVVILTPAYPLLREVVEAAGRRVVACALVDDGSTWRLNLDALDAALALRDVRTVLLCHPHNPTGRVWDPVELGALAEVVARRGCSVVSDEVHSPLLASGVRFTPYAIAHPAAAEHTVTVVSTSKGWGLARLRCALIVASPGMRDLVRRVPRFEQVRACGLGVVASITAWRNDGGWLDEVLAYLDGNRALLREWVDATNGVQMREPEGTFLGWLDFGPAKLGEDPTDFLLRYADVALSAGREYGADNCARITYATSRPILRLMLERIGVALRCRRSWNPGGTPRHWFVLEDLECP